ncbi:MAG: twin-arginine translocation pathway signal protein, partial [Phycisphaerales bacterium]
MVPRTDGLDRRELLGGAAALGIGAACSARGRASEPRAQRPTSVLVLLADDLSARDHGCYGCGDPRPPPIHPRAQRGARVTPADTPVGVFQPTRSRLNT